MRASDWDTALDRQPIPVPQCRDCGRQAGLLYRVSDGVWLCKGCAEPTREDDDAEI